MKWIALFLSAVASAWLMASPAGGLLSAAKPYVAWALVPHAVFFLTAFAAPRFRVLRCVASALGRITALLAMLGPLLYIDILFLRVDAQGALAMLMVPIIQTFLGLAAIAAMAIWQWRINRRVPQAASRGSTGSTHSS